MSVRVPRIPGTPGTPGASLRGDRGNFVSDQITDLERQKLGPYVDSEQHRRLMALLEAAYGNMKQRNSASTYLAGMV